MRPTNSYHGRVFSVSPAEMLTIAVVALLVFGPRRLPEIARRAGNLLRQAREAAAELKAGLEAEYDETLRPLEDLRRQIGSTLDDPPPADRPDEPPRERPGP
jgi:sec-independent protein translocase protein TatB